MFGKSNGSGNKTPPITPHRSNTADLAKIQGGGLVQLIVSDTYPIEFALFLNHKRMTDIDVDSVSIDIVAPVDVSDSVIVRATLGEYVTNVTGERVLQNRDLFPCTIEVVALDRRLCVTCTRNDSTEGLWVNVGLRPDGVSAELSGLREFRFLLTHELLDARVTWIDGESENLLPQSS